MLPIVSKVEDNREELHFMQNGGQPNLELPVHAWLYKNFHSLWIGRRGPT